VLPAPYAPDGFFGRHRLAVPEVLDAVVRDAYDTAGVRQTCPLSEKVDVDIPARVVRLDGVRRPSAIARLVVAIGVDPVDRLSRGTLAHVAKEGTEVISPFFAHGDATTAVNLISDFARVEASASSVHPTDIGRAECSVFPAGSSVLPTRFEGSIFVETTATLFDLTNKVARKCSYDGSTRASASPSALRFSGYGQSSEDVTDVQTL
jgi:hypothetical protein